MSDGSPQLENGYVRIATELFDALIRTPIGNANSQVFYSVIRKTYGYQKKSDDISISQIIEMTGLSRRMVMYTLQNLEAKRMIIIKRKRGRGNINEINHICINKNYNQWVVQEKSKQYNKVLKKRKENYSILRKCTGKYMKQAVMVMCFLI